MEKAQPQQHPHVHHPLPVPTADRELFETPADLVCPITLTLFTDPVINAMGQIYDRAAIEAHMANKLVDPVTNVPLPATTLTSVHLVRSRAMDYREKSARACVSRSLSYAVRDPTPYLRRACELAGPRPDLLRQLPGLTPEVVEYVACHAANAYGPLCLERFAEGLRSTGHLDEASALYLRLLELYEGETEMQARVLRACLACWADEHGTPDKEALLLRLATFIETQHTFSPGQVIDIVLETPGQSQALAMHLVEHLLAKLESSADLNPGASPGHSPRGASRSADVPPSSAAPPGGREQRERAVRQFMYASLLRKWAQMRADAGARDAAALAARVAVLEAGGGGGGRGDGAQAAARQASSAKQQQHSAGGGASPRVRGARVTGARALLERGVASGVYACLSLLGGGHVVLRAARAASFLLPMATGNDNEYIHRHYRRTLPVRDSICSLFGLHNETGNIYTHLLGFLLFLFFTIDIIRELPTPLAFGHSQVSALWSLVSSRLRSIEPMPMQDEISEGVRMIQEGFSEGVHSIKDAVGHLAPLELHTAVSGMLCWPTPRWPTYVYMAGAMTCLLTSSVCHLLGCCQKHISQLVWRFDYAGIAILIVTSFYPAVYYGFMCHPYLLAFYLASTTLLGIGAVCFSLLDRFQERSYRFVRAFMFTALGLYGIAPVLHQWLLFSHIPQVRTALQYDIAMGVTYVSGAMFYAYRIPERFAPGYFDLFMHSHQIFHCAVVAGAWIHLYSVRLMLEWRDASGGCAVPVTGGHVPSVLAQMRDLGHDLFSADEVMSRLAAMAHFHFGHNATAGAPGAE
ncbi:hypothetical protein FOA52_014170 [Chlamydomonas sp. UWO 241]|nr:hypothetical protein FOA52_014170 [Chlamydomonas sp. UWO 241]